MDRVDIPRPEPEMITVGCAKHGPYRAYCIPGAIQPANTCPVCIDERQSKVDAQRDAGRKERDMAAQRDRRRRSVLVEAGIPARFADLRLADYELQCDGQAQASGICRAYANTWKEQMRKGGVLVLTGKCGTGKTHLACAIANAVMHEHLASVAFASVSDMMRTIRATYGKNSTSTEAQALAKLTDPDLLIMDEVGAQSGSEHELQLMFEVINKRYQAQAPMILISNLNTGELERFLGNRVMSRLTQCGDVVAFDWDDYRKRGAK